MLCDNCDQGKTPEQKLMDAIMAKDGDRHSARYDATLVLGEAITGISTMLYQDNEHFSAIEKRALSFIKEELRKIRQMIDETE